MRGIVTCVGYDDLLAITLPRNMRHLDECLVVTSPDDKRTAKLALTVPGVRLHFTDAFTRHGAKFNKGLAMEEGFDALGRFGWILIWDADTLFPDNLQLPKPLEIGRLYGANRAFLEDPRQWRPDLDWSRFFKGQNWLNAIGYFQLFHAEDPTIVKRPWYDVTFAHAGGGDGYFRSRWPDQQVTIIQPPVLHLGPRDTNWCGRSTPRLDGVEVPNAAARARDMDRLLTEHGWHGRTKISGVFNDHVEVPGHQSTGFKP